jgi:hypothetical protein
MPYQIRKLRNKELFSVKNKETGKIHAHATTKANAKKQVKLLQAIDHGFVPSKDELEGGYLGETLVNLYNRVRRRRQNAVAPAPPEIPNPMGPLIPIDMTPEHNNQGNQIIPINVTPEMLFGPRGGARLNPAVQTMLNYLKSLYPHKTLISVANEILKLTGHKMTGKGRKPIKATEIAKYVIGAIGVALAVAVAIFLLNQDKKEELGSPIKISNDILNQPERKRIVSVFDDPNSELYKQREMYKQQAQQPIQIPEMKKPLSLPISTPSKPVSKSKGPSDSYKKEVEKVKERLIELDNKKKEEDRQKLMKHLYDDFDGRKPKGYGRKRRLKKV